MKNKKWLIGGVAGVVVIAAVIGVLCFLGGGKKLAFSNDMITETIVNEVCDITDFVENPEEKIIKLTATYQDEMGNEQQYLAAGLSFKPIKVGEVHLKVEATDGESIETTIEVVEAAPQVITTNDAIYYLRQTIKLQDLLQHVEYNSNSEPEFFVHSLEFGAENIDLSKEEEYTFEEIGSYAFQVELKNHGGSAEAIITVKVVPELTDKEKDDLTNNSILGIGSHATLSLCEDDHANNSDWCWEITAHPGDVWVEGGGTYYHNVVWVDFGQEVDLSKYYFTMDLKASENSAGIAVHYLSAAQRMSEIPMGFQNVLGRWTHISSQDKYDEGLYTGIYIVVMHKKEGNYDPTNVKVWIDNLHLHPYQDPNAPIIVGGTEDFEITSGKVTWSSELEDTGHQANYVQFNKDYTNQTFTFTTTIQDAAKPNLIIGARMDGAKTAFDKNSGVILRFHDKFFEIFAPKYGQKWVGAENVSFESGKKYTFAYSVETLGGQDMFFLKITDASGKEILNYSLELPSGVVNKSGDFVIWSINNDVVIEYEEPKTAERKANVNVVVAEDGKAGVAGISTATPGAVSKASYLAIDGKYTNETFSFKTKIEDGKTPNIVIGARMDAHTSNPDKSKGLTIQFYNGFFEIYAPKYGTFVDAEHLTLKTGETYTFNIAVETKGSVSALSLVVKQGNQTILNYTKDDIATALPVAGSFMVWSLNESTEITYQMPEVVIQPENKNVVVEMGASAGVAELETVITDDISKSSYLVMEGDYTNETFEFTTTFTAKKTPMLVIGAHMDGVDSNPDKCSGVTIGIHSNFYEVYAPKYGTWIAAENYTDDQAELNMGIPYTFGVQIIDGYLNITVKLNDSIVHTNSIELPTTIPAEGNFVVWNTDATRSVEYQMPVYVEPATNVNVEVEANGEAGTAQLKTVTPNDVAQGSYLAMKGAYTNETFEFTTTIADGANPNLVIGARMADVVMNPDKADGVTIRFYNGFLELYAPKYGTWVHAKSLTLESGKAYTFSVQMDGSELKLVVKDGETVVLDYSKAFEATIPESGNFMVWSLDAERSIDYAMPIAPVVEPETNTNVEVETTGEAGTAQLKTVTPNDVAQGSYLAMKGAYTNETFEFTTTIADGANPNLVIGARMADVVMNPDKADGVTVRFYNGFLELYAPKYGTWVAAKSLTLESGKAYTFSVQMDGNELKLVVKDGETVVLDYSKALEATIPESGNFMVWSLDAERSIDYKMPVAPIVEPETNTNVEVESAGTAGTAQLKTVTPNDVAQGSYLAMKGAYTNETFEFTTTIADGANPNLVIGARMADVVMNPDKADGVTIRFYNGFLELYAPKYGTWVHAKSITLESGKAYTFSVQMDGSTLKLVVKQGETVVLDYTKEVSATIPASGNFMVWSLDAERSIDYKMPVASVEILSGEALLINSNKGTATMFVPNNVGLWNQAYLMTKNIFSIEHFRFATTIADGANPNLVIGARVQGESPSYGAYDGLVYRLYNGFYETYYIKDGQSNVLGAKSLALTSGVEYTFDLCVITVAGTTSTRLIVKQGETEVHNKLITTTETIPATGRFAIWSQEARTVKYEINQ